MSDCKSKLSALSKGPATITYYIAALSHLFSVTTREWQWTESNPFKNVSKPKLPRPTARFLSGEERKSLLVACRESYSLYLYVIVLIALSTGARKQEIMSLTWNDLDFDRKRITIQKTKNGEIKVLPMIGEVIDELRKLRLLRRIDTAFVFPREDGKAPLDIRKSWEGALRASGVANFWFHALRHSCGSYLAMSGASPSEIAAVLGHKTLSMVKRYAHVSDSHTAGVVEGMSERFLK